MAQRLKFTAPVTVVFKGLEIDRIDSLDPTTGVITGFYSLLRADGRRWRSIPFSMTMAAALRTFEGAILNRLANQVDKIDGVDAALAGVVEDVPPGTVIP